MAQNNQFIITYLTLIFERRKLNILVNGSKKFLLVFLQGSFVD